MLPRLCNKGGYRTGQFDKGTGELIQIHSQNAFYKKIYWREVCTSICNLRFSGFLTFSFPPGTAVLQIYCKNTANTIYYEQKNSPAIILEAPDIWSNVFGQGKLLSTVNNI